jgi:hypothetical protein
VNTSLFWCFVETAGIIFRGIGPQLILIALFLDRKENLIIYYWSLSHSVTTTVCHGVYLPFTPQLLFQDLKLFILRSESGSLVSLSLGFSLPKRF